MNNKQVGHVHPMMMNVTEKSKRGERMGALLSSERWSVKASLRSGPLNRLLKKEER